MKRAAVESEALRREVLAQKRQMFAAVKVQSMWRGKVSRRGHVCKSYEHRRLSIQTNSLRLMKSFEVHEEKKDQ